MNTCESPKFFQSPAHSSALTGGIYHDPQVFDDPEIFDPDRYIRTEYGTKAGVDDSDFRHTFIFGSGRVCRLVHAHFLNTDRRTCMIEDMSWHASC